MHSYLQESSVVIEVGGYTGVDIKKMREKYGLFKTLLFEPIFHEQARENLKGLGVEIYPYGLGAHARTLFFSDEGDATRPTSSGKSGEIRSFSEVLKALSITKVDLLQINCEGCEWEILETILLMPHVFQRIQVQFHAGAEWVENRLSRYGIIQDRLTETHELLYDHPWIWQLWQSKHAL